MDKHDSWEERDLSGGTTLLNLVGREEELEQGLKACHKAFAYTFLLLFRN